MRSGGRGRERLGQSGVAARTAGFVEVQGLGEQESDRQAVDHDVVTGEAEPPHPRCEPQQGGAEQRSANQIEGPVALLLRLTVRRFLPPLPWQRGQIDERHVQDPLGKDLLERLLPRISGRQDRPQGFVAAHHVLERPPQESGIERSADLDDGGFQKGQRGLLAELRQGPQVALWLGQGDSNRFSGRPAGAEAPLQLGDPRQPRLQTGIHQEGDLIHAEVPQALDEGCHRLVGADERHMAGGGWVAGAHERLPVDLQMSGQCLDRLPLKVCQDARGHLAGEPVQLRAVSCCDPDGKIALRRQGIDPQIDLGAGAVAQPDALAPPQAADGAGACSQIAVSMAGQHEVSAVAARGEGEADAPAREVVHQCPFLHHAHGVVERERHAPRAQCDVLRLPRQSRGQDGRVGRQPGVRLEVALGEPETGEARPVGGTGPFQDQLEGTGAGRGGGASGEGETETDLSWRRRKPPAFRGAGHELVERLGLQPEDADRRVCGWSGGGGRRADGRDTHDEASHCRPGCPEVPPA